MDLEQITVSGGNEPFERNLIQPGRQHGDCQRRGRDLAPDRLDPDTVTIELGFRAIEVNLQFAALKLMCLTFSDERGGLFDQQRRDFAVAVERTWICADAQSQANRAPARAQSLPVDGNANDLRPFRLPGYFGVERHQTAERRSVLREAVANGCVPRPLPDVNFLLQPVGFRGQYRCRKKRVERARKQPCPTELTTPSPATKGGACRGEAGC